MAHSGSLYSTVSVTPHETRAAKHRVVRNQIKAKGKLGKVHQSVAQPKLNHECPSMLMLAQIRIHMHLRHAHTHRRHHLLRSFGLYVEYHNVRKCS